MTYTVDGVESELEISIRAVPDVSLKVPPDMCAGTPVPLVGDPDGGEYTTSIDPENPKLGIIKLGGKFHFDADADGVPLEKEFAISYRVMQYGCVGGVTRTVIVHAAPKRRIHATESFLL